MSPRAAIVGFLDKAAAAGQRVTLNGPGGFLAQVRRVWQGKITGKPWTEEDQTKLKVRPAWTSPWGDRADSEYLAPAVLSLCAPCTCSPS